jgi:hypothetical protein
MRTHGEARAARAAQVTVTTGDGVVTAMVTAGSRARARSPCTHEVPVTAVTVQAGLLTRARARTSIHSFKW